MNDGRQEQVAGALIDPAPATCRLLMTAVG